MGGSWVDPTSARAYLLLSPLHIRLPDAFEERISWLLKKKKAGGRLVYTAWFALSTLFCSTVTSSNLNWQAWGLRGSKFLRGSSSENMWLSMDSFMWTKNEAVRRHRIQENWVVHWLSVNLLKIHLPKGDSPKHQFPVNLFSENISAERSTCLIPWKLSNKYFRPDLRQFAATVS